jgi:hypothetical protein
MTYLFDDKISYDDTSNLDAFGRLRVSQPYTLGDYKHLYSIDPNFVDVLEFGGNIQYLRSQACAKLTTNTHPRSNVVHQTKMYHHYMPGKSQLIKSTLNFNGNVANTVKRTGYFDDYNGIYLELAGDGTLSFCIRSDVSGSVSDARKVPQSQWNKDKCDGTGISGFNIDVNTTNIFFTDFQWLGVGRVRCGFIHNGETIVAHEFYNDNFLNTVYMSNPNLPVRCEVRNTGVSLGANLDQICSTVISEGGYVESGQDWAIVTPSLRQVTANNTLPIIAIKLSNAFRGYENRATVRMGSISLLSNASSIVYKLIKLPNEGMLSGGDWSNVNTSSAVQYNANALSYFDGEEIDNGYITAATGAGGSGKNIPGTLSPNNPSTAKKNFITQNFYSSNSEVFVITVTNLTTDTTFVSAGVQWREIY